MAFYGGSYMNVSLEKEHSKHFLRTTMCMHTVKKMGFSKTHLGHYALKSNLCVLEHLIYNSAEHVGGVQSLQNIMVDCAFYS